MFISGPMNPDRSERVEFIKSRCLSTGPDHFIVVFIVLDDPGVIIHACDPFSSFPDPSDSPIKFIFLMIVVRYFLLP